MDANRKATEFYAGVIKLANGQFQPVVFRYGTVEPVERAQAVRTQREAAALAEHLLKAVQAFGTRADRTVQA